MSRRRALLVAASLLALACQQQPITVPLRSLERSGDVAFVCVDPTDDSGHPGRDVDACPDFAEGKARFYALVTQTARGEVAVVDLSEGTVVDGDPSTPGFNFLPIGQQPRDIVSTPGGAATFVGVAEPGREGIFALSSSCILPPQRDLLSWPACALPSAPGDMFIVFDRAKDAAGSPRASCLATPPEQEPFEHECRADLSRENVAGRHKLAVVLPEEGMLAVVDAQRLLDRQPGSFQPCPIERWFELTDEAIGTPPEQVPPPDLVAQGCDPTPLNHGPGGRTAARPVGGALSGDLLYLADRGAPLIHVVDLSDPCAPMEMPPLLPTSWVDPGRTVTTNEVAVSPQTTDGRRFLYAIDDDNGSVMIFDVSDDASNRTPLVRERSPRFPFEAPDRIAFSAPARDVEFVLRDRPIINDTTGVAIVGEACEPDYRRAGPDTPGAQYRPSPDLTDGASPGNLRGIFGFIALSSGQVAVIDVEDFDARCRRPLQTNSVATASLETEDFRGCADPGDVPDFYTIDGTPDETPTVTGEVSCQMVQRHRSRSATFARTSSSGGIRAPGLRSFPRLKFNGATLPTDQTDDGRSNPKLLGARFAAGEPVQVFVGTTLYSTEQDADDELVISPAVAENNSVVVRYNEPRAFAAEEDYVAVYEGAVVGERSGGIVNLRASDARLEGLVDFGGSFCSGGVQDVQAVRAVAQELGVPSSAFDAFARRHADYAQITAELLDEDDGYWKSGQGATCGGAASSQASFLNCRTEFGSRDAPTDSRDLRILEAYQDQIVLEPRRSVATKAERDRVIDMIECCFPTAVSYRVRAGHQWVVAGAGGFRHSITTDSVDSPRGKRRCVPDCDPFKANLNSRAFEVSCLGSCGADTNDSAIGAIGGPVSAEVLDPGTGLGACTITSIDQIANDPSHPCIFDDLTHRFVIYRGSRLTDDGEIEPRLSERDMAFSWQIVGGFRPLLANLASQTSAVSPQSMVFVPQLGRIAIVDGQSEGLAFLSLRTIGVARVFF